MSGCLWSFLPFPILIALYYIIRTPLRYFMSLSNEVIAKITELAAVSYTHLTVMVSPSLMVTVMAVQ